MRTLLAALVLVLAAAGAWWLLGDRDEPAAPLPAAGSDAETAREPGPRESAPSREAASNHNAIESPSTPTSFAFRIRVVRDEDGAPVEGAELRVAPSESTAKAWPAEQQRRAGEDHVDYVFRAGFAWRSDASGRAVIAQDEQAVWVYARSGDLLAGDRLLIDDGKQSGDFELRLVCDATLVFLTLDESGAAVAGVQLLMNSAASPNLIGFGTSDSAGRVTMRHAQDARRLHAGEPSFGVIAKVLGAPGATMKVPLDPLPVDPVVVPVPPCATLEVAATDSRGEPWPFAKAQRAAVYAATSGPATSIFAVFDEQGVARIEHVRCGTIVELSCEELAGARLTTTAPERAREVKRVELRLDPSAIAFTGRLLSPTGATLSGKYVLAYQADTVGGFWNIVSGADGRFRRAVEQVSAGMLPIIHASGDSADQPPLLIIATVALRRPLESGINDLGDIVLAPAPELVSGRIERSDRGAVGDLSVSIEREDEPGRWRNDGTVRVRVSDDGRFTVWGLHDQRRCRIDVGKRGLTLQREPIVFAPGARDLVIRVECGATIEASFLIDAATPWKLLDYSLVALNREGMIRGTRPKTSARDGRVTAAWRGLPPGRYRLRVSDSLGIEQLVAIDDIAAVAEPAGEDPRLRDIDLRGRVERCELLMVGPDDQPIAERSLRLRPAAQANSWTGGARISAARFEMALRSPIEVVIEASGYLAQEHRAVAGRATVRMERAPEYLLRCNAPLPPRTALQLRAHLLASPNRDEQRLVIASEEPVAWSPGTDGSYAIELDVARGATTVSVKKFAPARIDVRTLNPGQIIDIIPDPDALAAAVANLKE